MSDIYERWGMQLSSDEVWQQMKNRILTIIDVFGYEIEEAEAINIAMRLGRRKNQVASYNNYDHVWNLDLGYDIENCSSAFELARIIEALMNSVPRYGLKTFVDQMQKIFDRANTPLRLVKIKGTWLTYPKGEKLLDEKLVEASLSFLVDKSLDEFEKALVRYSQGQWVESAEKSRRSLEEFLRQKLNSPTVGLQAAIKKIGDKLKEVNSEPHIRKLVVNQLLSLDAYFNDASKHASKSNDTDAEYVLYQAATVMKFLSNFDLITVKQ